MSALRDGAVLLNKAHLAGAIGSPAFAWRFVERLEAEFGSPAALAPAHPNVLMRTAAEAENVEPGSGPPASRKHDERPVTRPFSRNQVHRYSHTRDQSASGRGASMGRML